MIKLTSVFLGTGIVLGFAFSGLLHAEKTEMTIPPGYFARHLGQSALPDPSGVTHTQQEVAGRVVVAIFSAPTMSQGDKQEKWSELLTTGSTRVSDAVALVLVEDMTQAGMFKGIALSDMKKQFTPKSRPFLILDQTGEVIKKFGVPRNQTAILIYDTEGKLRDVEVNLSDAGETARRVQAISRELQHE